MCIRRLIRLNQTLIVALAVVERTMVNNQFGSSRCTITIITQINSRYPSLNIDVCKSTIGYFQVITHVYSISQRAIREIERAVIAVMEIAVVGNHGVAVSATLTAGYTILVETSKFATFQRERFAGVLAYIETVTVRYYVCVVKLDSDKYSRSIKIKIA